MKHWYAILEDKVMTMVLFFTEDARDDWVRKTEGKVWKTGFAKHIALYNEEDDHDIFPVMQTHDAGAY